MEHVLRESLEKGIPVTIIYMSGDRITERTVSVRGIRDGLVRAYCHMRKEPRVFRLENILAAHYCRTG